MYGEREADEKDNRVGELRGERGGGGDEKRRGRERGKGEGRGRYNNVHLVHKYWKADTCMQTHTHRLAHTT